MSGTKIGLSSDNPSRINLEPANTSNIITGLSVPQNAKEAAEIYKSNSEVARKKLVELDAVEKYFPGFLNEQENGVIFRLNGHKLQAEDTWKSGDSINFSIEPGNSAIVDHGFNPSMVELILRGKFVASNGTDQLPDDQYPCSGWLGKYIENVTESTLGGISITPTESPGNREYFKELYINTPKDRRHLLDVLHLDPNKITRSRKVPANADTHSTKWQKEEAAKNAHWIATNTYRIPLKFIAPSFRRNALEFDGVNVNLKIEKESVKYMESIKKDGELNDKAGKFILEEQPYLMIPYYKLSSAAQNYYNSMFEQTKKYNYGSIENFTIYNQQLTPGQNQATFSFPSLEKKFNFFGIFITEKESNDHLSLYDVYDYEMASTLLKKITIQRFQSTKTPADIIRFDLSETVDKIDLYKQYLGYVTKTCTDLDAVDQIDNAAAENLPKYEDYYSKKGGGFPVYVDLSDSKGYTGLKDPVDIDQKGMSLNIQLNTAVPTNKVYEVRIFGINEAVYLRGKTNKAPMLQLIEKTKKNMPFFVQETTDPITIDSSAPRNVNTDY